MTVETSLEGGLTAHGNSLLIVPEAVAVIYPSDVGTAYKTGESSKKLGKTQSIWVLSSTSVDSRNRLHQNDVQPIRSLVDRWWWLSIHSSGLFNGRLGP